MRTTEPGGGQALIVQVRAPDGVDHSTRDQIAGPAGMRACLHTGCIRAEEKEKR
jgi:hypothetical protein